MTTIGKPDLISHISCSSGVDKKTVQKVFDASLESIKSILQAGQEIRLLEFGVFTLQKSKEKRGFNIRTKEQMTIPSAMRLRFKISKDLKNRIKGTMAQDASKAKPKKIAEKAKAEQATANQPEKRKTLTLKHQSKTA